MTIETKQYVVFLSPGTFFDETTARPIDVWVPQRAVEMAKDIVERYGATPYAFYFETRLESEPISDGRGGTMTVQPKSVATSRRYFINGRVETIEDVEARVLSSPDRDRILLSNMRSSQKALVVVTENSYRHTAFFEGDDAIVDSDGNITEYAAAQKWHDYQNKVFPDTASL